MPILESDHRAQRANTNNRYQIRRFSPRLGKQPGSGWDPIAAAAMISPDLRPGNAHVKIATRTTILLHA